MMNRFKRFISLTCALTMLSGVTDCFTEVYPEETVESLIAADAVTEPAQPEVTGETQPQEAEENSGENIPEEVSPAQQTPEEAKPEEQAPAAAPAQEEPAQQPVAAPAKEEPAPQPAAAPAKEEPAQQPAPAPAKEEPAQQPAAVPAQEGTAQPEPPAEQSKPAANEESHSEKEASPVETEVSSGIPDSGNEDQAPQDSPKEESGEEELKELLIDGKKIRDTAAPEKAVKLLLRTGKTDKIRLTVVLAAEGKIQLAVNDKALDPAETTADEETGEQTLAYSLKVKAGESYTLEISAEVNTPFSIQAAWEKEETGGEETEEQTEVRDESTPGEPTGETEPTDEASAEPALEDTAEEPAGEPGNQDETGGEPVPEDTTEEPAAEEPAAEEEPGEADPAEDAGSGENDTEDLAAEDSADGNSEDGESAAEDSEDGQEAEPKQLSEGGTLTATVSDCTVTVQYGAEALFPENVVLSVSEILPGTPRYAELTGMTEEMLTDDWSEAGAFQRIFDITFLDGETEIEPAAPIQVDFRFSDPVTLEENSSLQVVHVDNENNAEIVPNDTSATGAGDNGAMDVDGISFTSDSFSTYVFFQTNNIPSKTIGDETHNVSITYGRESGIPENSQVAVTAIEEGTETYETFRRQLIQQLNLDESRQTVLFSALYDITILDENKKEVPLREDATVTVKAELPADAAVPEGLLVVHFDGDGTSANELEATTEENVVTFETNGFSVYGFAYTVDYAYEGREYRMQGGNSMTLSELFALLEIPESAAEAEKVVFSNPSLVQVEQTEGDWLLTSLRPFVTEESLVITLADGRMIRIAVTDDSDPWYIQDGALHILADTAMNFTSATKAPWYEERGNIISIVIEDGVTKIPQNFLYSNTSTTNYPNLTDVVIADSVRTVGANAFCNCPALKNVTMGEGIKSLPSSAFSYCTSLETIDLSHVTSVGSYSFQNCTALKEVITGDEPTSIQNYAFLGCKSLETIDLSHATALGYQSFYGCSSLKEANAVSARTVSDYAFQNCTALEKVNLDSATSINSTIFYSCSNLKEVTLGENLKIISGSTFAGKTKLEKINLENVETIDSYAFNGCTALKNVDLSSAVTINYSAFNGCNSLTEVEIPESVTSIGSSAFASCKQLETVYFDPLNRMTTLSSSVFSGCTKLKEVALPQDLHTIPSYLFSGCTSLETVDMPKSLNIIDSYAFDGCSSLTDAALPAHVTEIRNYAFRKCSKLEDVTFPATLTKIGEYAYQNCDIITDISLPAAVSTIGTEAFSYCDNLEFADLSRSSLTTVPSYSFRENPKLETVLLPGTLTEIQLSAFNNDQKLSEINLPESLTKIGNSAFSQCKALSVINEGEPGVLEIPGNVTSVGTSAFNDCDTLTEVSVPDSVEELGSSAFANCDNLEKAVIGTNIKTINTSLFYNDPKLKSVTFKSTEIEEIPSNAFRNCTNLEDFPLWEGLKKIGTNAFEGCNKLSDITFPSTLERIDDYAYYRCRGLTDLVFEDADPDSGTTLTIGKYAFAHYRSQPSTLKHVRFPRQLTSIDECAFSNNYGISSGTSSSYRSPLAEIEFPEDCELKTIGNAAFRNTSIKQVELPGKLETIGGYAFRSNVYLESVTFPESLKSIGTYAFNACSALKTVDIPDSVDFIGTYAFSSCTAMTEAKLPKGLTKLEEGVFSGCSSLSGIDLPETLTSIGASAFYNCNKLKEIELPESLTSIGNSAFSYCSALKTIDIPDSVNTIGTYAFSSCTAMTEAKLPKNLQDLKEGVFYNCTKLKNVELPETLKTIGSSTFNNCTSLPKIELPATVTSIGSNAFYNCYSMTEVKLPADSGLTSIGSCAFQSCSRLRGIDLPDTVSTIGSYAFDGCTDLKTADLSDGLKTISTGTFRNCKNLTDIDLHKVENIGEESFINCKALEEIDLPDTLKTISKNAFNGCTALKELDIPADVTSIGDGAFTGCKSLESMRWNAKDGAIGPFNSNTRFELTIGKDVNNISAETLTNLFKGGAEEIRFEGGNYLTLPDTTGIIDGTSRKLPRPLNDLDAGSYYADENGVLYAVRDGQAMLVYLPDGLENYTIPETIPAENGDEPIPVTGVKANALCQAEALTTLTIENPEKLTNIESRAFANAQNLASVNGKTTIEEATALFTHPELTIGNQIFYNTKLSGEEGKSSADPLAYTDNEDPEQATLQLTITEKGATYRGDMAGTPKQDDTLLTDPATNTYMVYTGETVTTRLQISNPASEVITDGQKLRVYIQLDEGGEIKNYKVGEPNDIEQTMYVDGKPVTIDEKYRFTLVETDVKGVYYSDFDRPANGCTATISLPMIFASPTTSGGNAVIWAQYMTKEQSEANEGKALPPAANHHTINWCTHPDEFPVTKKLNSTSTPPVTAGQDGEIYVNSHSYRIEMHRENTQVLSVGRDNMARVVFTDTFTIPDLLKVNPTILNEIREGKIRYKDDGYNKYAVSPTYGNILTLYVSSYYSSVLQPVLSVNEDGKLQLQWTVVNPNPNHNGEAEEIDLPGYFTVTVSNRVFAMKEKTANTEFTIHNDVSADQYYSYSGKHTKTAEAEYKGKTGSAVLEFNKTSTRSSVRGAYAPFTLQLKSNGVLPVTSAELASITDDIASTHRHFYIPPEGIWQMFQDPRVGNGLTLTVSKAHLYDGTNTGHTVTTVSGNTGTTDQTNTGSQTHYDGPYSGADAHETDTNATFIFTKENGNVKVTLNTNGEAYTGEMNSAEDIRSFMDRYGFFVTRWTAYKAEWDTTKITDFAIQPGEDWRITIPTRLKDTFMTLESDDDEWLEMEYEARNGTYNTATALYNGNNLSKSDYTTYSNDAVLSKSRSFEKSFYYRNEYTDLEVPEVIRYNVAATHSGSTSYGLMPLTDHMTLRQQLLVPVKQNEDKAWAAGLETYILNGLSYYILGAGEYKDVYTGNAWADHVKVEEKNGGYDTLIYWYLDGYGGNKTNTISYLAKVEHDEFIPLQKAFEFENESWLGDHETHRLWDSIRESGVVKGEPLVTGYDKKIVDYIGDTSEGREYSFVARGEQVIYRLTFASDLHTDFTINGKQFYDVLPQTSKRFAWSKENVSLTYWNFKTNGPDKWDIVKDENHADGSYQRIKWDDDFEMQCTSDTGRAYIYVTVKFPTNEEPAAQAWENYVQTHQGGILYNTFYIKKDWLNWSNAAVMHELTDTAEVRLQKGVYATGGVNDDNVDIYRTGGDSRVTYENNDVMKRKVYYYITLHNGGYTNLYLNDIQDVLPKGFTLASASKPYASSTYAESTPRIMDSSYAKVSDPDGPNVSYISASNSSLTYRTDQTEDGRQRITITVKPYSRNGDGTSHFNKYLDGGRYFLRPGETVVIRLDCFTNEYPQTEDTAKNTAVMPYYDFYNQGVTIDSSDSTSGDRTALSGAEKNDGGCAVTDGTQVQSEGFSTAGQTKATRWLYSDVTVSRGEIRPGISKRLLRTLETNADGIEVPNDNPGIVHPNDKLVWKVQAENAGSSAVMDYVISDMMPYPYSFIRDVTYKQIYNSDGESSPEIILFSIRDRSVYTDVNGDKHARPEMTFVTFTDAKGETEAQSYPYTIGGDPVEMTVPNWRGGEDRIQVSIEMVKDNETMFIRFINNDMGVLSGGKIAMTFCSQNLPGLMQNTVFINQSYITPSAEQQSIWNGQTDEGSIADWKTPYEVNKMRSVQSSAQITSSYGGATSSIKAIKENIDPANQTDSEKNPNFITLRNKQSTFTYSLGVTNSTYSPIKDLVLIDNLPEENDHTTFQADDPRHSAFRVLFTENPNFTLTVRSILTQNTTTVDKSYYQVELSKLTTFSTKDRSGFPSADWKKLEDIPAEEIPSYRSVRIIFHDSAKTDGTSVFKRNHEIMLSFGTVIDGSDANALPGTIAWNSFGYYFMDDGTPMEAAPLKVGIRIPDLPKVTKTLINSQGDPYRAEKEESFTYVLYKGGAITLPEGKTVEEAVRDAGRDYAKITVTVPFGETEADPVSFNGVTGYYRSGSQYQDSEWNMVNNTTYTICEEHTADFDSWSYNGQKQKTQYSFTYKANQNAFSIASVNRHDDWSLKLLKTDQFDRDIGNAVFAFYTPLEKEYCMTETAYDATTLESLNNTYGLTLEEKPAFIRTDGGIRYGLYTIVKTSDIGSLQLDELMGSSYLWEEIQRPGEYYREDKEDSTVHIIHRAERPTATESPLKTITAMNYYIASDKVTVDAKKNLAGRAIEKDEFRFTLEGYDLVNKRPLDNTDPQQPMPAVTETTCGTDGRIQFGPIPLTQDDIGKTYCYRISEMIPDEANKAYGVTYDERKIIVKLTVTDGGEGKLDKTLVYSVVNENGEEITLTGDDAMFRNIYTDKIKLKVKTKKNLEGRPWKTSDSYTFRLSGIPNPEDEEAPLHDITMNVSVRESLQDPDFNLEYNENDIGHTYYYTITEVIHRSAVAYNADTGAKVVYGRRDLTYSKYNGLSEEEKSTLPPAEKIRWKYNGMICDSTVHTLKVAIGYDRNTGKLTMSALLDGQLLASDKPVVFNNTYEANSVQTAVPVGKTLRGRPWKRPVNPTDPDADPYPDAYRFTIEPANPDEYAPLPEKDGRTITIERGTTIQPETQAESFQILYQWDDLLVNGERQSSREFHYIIREEIDPEQAAARIEKDEDGHITGYVLDQITYDLTTRRVKVTLRDDNAGGLETEVSYIDEEGKPIGTLVKDTDPFINTYKVEPIDVPIRLNKLVNGITAPGGGYTFTLTDEAGQVLEDDLTITAEDGKAELSTVIRNVGVEFKSYSEKDPRTYIFKLRENIPESANGYRDGKQLGADGNVLETDGEPMVYGTAGEYRSDAGIVWKKDGMIYDAPEITITVVLKMNQLQYRLESTVTYSPDPETEESAVFTNHYEAEGTGTVRVEKTIDGRGYLGSDGFVFELTGIDNAPLRTKDGDADKLTVTAVSAEAAAFKDLAFSLADLKNADGTWSGKDFRYRIHENVPEDASVQAGEEELLYRDATDEQKAEYDGKWTWKGMTYAKDQTVVLHVEDSLTGELTVTYGGDADKAGTAAFENRYNAGGSCIVSAEKHIEGREFLEGDKFTFELTPTGGAPMRTEAGKQEKLTVETTNAEAVSFDELLFLAEDLKNEDGTWSREKEFSYILHEAVPEDASVQDGENELLYRDATDEQKKEHDGEWTLKGITYAKDRTVTLKVADDGEGNLNVTWGAGLDENGKATVVNPYDAEGSQTLWAAKHIDGRGFLEGDSFTFELTPVDGAPLRTENGTAEALTAKAVSAEAAAFEELLFRLEDLKNGDGTWSAKEFSYLVHEVIPDDASVTDGGSELLYRDASEEKRQEYAGKWALDGFTYAAEDRMVTLAVADDGMGSLVISCGGDSDENGTAEFTNPYDASGTGTVRVTKHIDGRGFLPGESFDFELTAMDDAPLRTAGGEQKKLTVKASSGKTVSFEDLLFVLEDLRDEDGTVSGKDFRYRIQEVIPGDAMATDGGKRFLYKDALAKQKQAFDGKWTYRNMTYAKGQEIILHAEDDGKGDITVTFGEGLDKDGTTEFTNVYKAEGKAVLKGQKVIQNRPFAQDDTLKVTVSAAEGVKLPEAAEIDVPLKEGEYTAEFSFGEILYDQDDMEGESEKIFTYLFTETAEMEGTTPDAGRHTATVKLTDDGKGQLLAEVTYSDGEELVFVNPYTETKGTLVVEKHFRFRNGTEEENLQPEDGPGTPETPPSGKNEKPVPTLSVTVRKIWNDDNNAAGLRPARVTMTLSNGMKVTLNEGNGWQATVAGLPAEINGRPAAYTWKESEVPGYRLVSTTVTGGITIFVNEPLRRGNLPEGRPVGAIRGDPYAVIDDYETALGTAVTINHVGDCFD